MSKLSMATENKWTVILNPATDAAGRSSAIESLKNVAGKAYIAVTITQGNAATVLLTPMQAQDVSGTAAKVLANPVPIFADLATGTSDALVRQTDAVNFTTDAALATKLIIFEIDPTQLDVNNGFDCLYITTGASNVANITTALLIGGELRYQSQSPPSMIVN